MIKNKLMRGTIVLAAFAAPVAFNVVYRPSAEVSAVLIWPPAVESIKDISMIAQNDAESEISGKLEQLGLQADAGSSDNHLVAIEAVPGAFPVLPAIGQGQENIGTMSDGALELEAFAMRFAGKPIASEAQDIVMLEEKSSDSEFMVPVRKVKAIVYISGQANAEEMSDEELSDQTSFPKDVPVPTLRPARGPDLSGLFLRDNASFIYELGPASELDEIPALMSFTKSKEK